MSDYGYGVVTSAVIDAVAGLQKQMPRTLIVDARDLSRHQRVSATAVKPNYGEACRLLGERERSEPRSRAAQMASQGPRLLELTGARIAAVTLDTEGAFIFERGRPPYRTYARPQNHSRCAGAGDTFVSALALALAAGAGTPAASELASAAAAVVVAKDGTSACSADELRASLLVGVKRVDGAEKLAARIAFERARGRRIVFTNGCFDILHRGHVTYLNRAKALGDILVVGVNSDASVRRLKGESRPINLLDDRIGVLEALSCVDLVVPFSAERRSTSSAASSPTSTPRAADYTIDRLPEAEVVEQFGGVVQILPLVDDRSTSRIIERVLDIQPAASPADGRRRPTRKVGDARPRPPMTVDRGWETAERILAVRLDAMGDVVMTTPALRAIRAARPNAHLALLTSPAGAAVASLVDEVDEVIEYEAPWLKPVPSDGVDAARDLAFIEDLPPVASMPPWCSRSTRRAPCPRRWPVISRGSRCGSPTAARTRTTCSPTGSPTPSPTRRSVTRSSASSTSWHRSAIGPTWSTSRSVSRPTTLAACGRGHARLVSATAGHGWWPIPARARHRGAIRPPGTRGHCGASPARTDGASC